MPNKEIARIDINEDAARAWAAIARSTGRYASVRVYPRSLSADGVQITVYAVVVRSL